MNDVAPPQGVFAAALIAPDRTFHRLSPFEAFSAVPLDGLLWMHLDRRSEAVQQWLYESSGISEIDADALLSEETRPRAYRARNQAGLLVILRGANNQPGADPEDMVSIRIWVEKTRVLSFSSRPLAPVTDVLELLGGDYGPGNAASLLAALATQMLVRLEPAIDELEDALDALEEELDAGRRIDTAELVRIRRSAAAFRRYLGPQREAFVAIDAMNLPWLGISGADAWREATNTVNRYIEELDAIRERIAIVNETLNARVVARANRTANTITVIASFFVPLTFVTGLLGMNVGGIPGGSHPLGFAGVLGVLFTWALVQYLVFRRFRWL
jgi:zinc transporter